MITKFRIEGRGSVKEELIEELSVTGTQIMRLVTPGTAVGEWECTDDVVVAEKEITYGTRGIKSVVATGNYCGRMNFVFRNGV